MAILQKGSSVVGRIEAGERVLTAAGLPDAARRIAGDAVLAAKLDAFVKAHRAYVRANGGVRKAQDAHAAQLARVAEADVAMDDAVDAFANALVAEKVDGLTFPRANPFKALGFPAPSRVKALGYGAQASLTKEILTAARAVLPKRSRALVVARELDVATDQVLMLLVPLVPLAAMRALAIEKRQALELPWEHAFAALKRASRVADDDHAAKIARGDLASLFLTLFGLPAKR